MPTPLAKPNAPSPQRATVSRLARIAVLVTVLPACVQSDFYGDTHPPTAHAQLFENIEDIDRPHERIGRLVTIERMASRQALIDAMQSEAARRGADAIVIISMDQFAWSDHDHAAELLDPELAPLAAATDSKLRWRGEALLLRWTGEPQPRPDTHVTP